MRRLVRAVTGSWTRSGHATKRSSTTELLELFEGYYETDKKQLENNFLISHTGFHVDLDLDHPALSDPGNVPRAAAPVRAEVGTGPGDCDIESLIATE